MADAAEAVEDAVSEKAEEIKANVAEAAAQAAEAV